MSRLIYLIACGLVGFAVTLQILPHLPIADGLTPKPFKLPPYERPGFEYFYQWTDDGEITAQVLYHDFGSSIENARAADILFFGNSRVPMGLRGEHILPRAEALGLKVFSLALARQPFRFDLEILRRYDLHPKIVIVSGGPEFYREGLVPGTQRAFEQSRWEAWREFFELQGSWTLRSRLHTSIPRLDLTGEVDPLMYITYRSSRSGFWVTRREAQFVLPAYRAPEPPSYEQFLPAAREIHKEITDRGSLMVLTMVPYTGHQPGLLPFLAEELDTPLIFPQVEGLETGDRQHLMPESAKRYSVAFWDQFIAEPTIREQLGLDRASPDPAAPRPGS